MDRTQVYGKTKVWFLWLLSFLISIIGMGIWLVGGVMVALGSAGEAIQRVAVRCWGLSVSMSERSYRADQALKAKLRQSDQ